MAGESGSLFSLRASTSIVAYLTEGQRAYLACLIDGEGSLETQKGFQRGAATPHFRIRLSFTMATEEPLLTVARWLEIAVPKVYPPQDETRSPRYRLHIPKNLTVEILRSVQPFLILKKRQAELVLEIERVRLASSPGRHHYGSVKARAMPAHAVALMEKLHHELRGLKSNKRPGKMRRRVNPSASAGEGVVIQ